MVMMVNQSSSSRHWHSISAYYDFLPRLLCRPHRKDAERTNDSSKSRGRPGSHDCHGARLPITNGDSAATSTTINVDLETQFAGQTVRYKQVPFKRETRGGETRITVQFRPSSPILKSTALAINDAGQERDLGCPRTRPGVHSDSNVRMRVCRLCYFLGP